MKNNPPTNEPVDQQTFPGVLRDAWQPEITHGPVTVEIRKAEKLIVIEHSADLIAALSPTECGQLERRLQHVLSWWAKEKNLPTI